MSDRFQTRLYRRRIRRQLLMTVSAIALLTCRYEAPEARAADGETDRPPVWIELGGQLEGLSGQEEKFAPPFMLVTPPPPYETESIDSIEKPPRFSIGGESEISFEPNGTNWVFAAGIRYGRANGRRPTHEQPFHGTAYTRHGIPYYRAQPVNEYLDALVKHNESHAILDFQAGKDFGLGMFRSKGSSVFSAGVRFAQFDTHSDIQLNSHTAPSYTPQYGTETAARSLWAVGPSLSWNASAPLIGAPEGGHLSLDMGANAAVLFGKQKADIRHMTTRGGGGAIYSHHASPMRSKSVVVPDLGAFAGVSFRFPAAKVSLGYRADLFFGAMDGGIDAAKRTTTGFYGPFASISIGIGG